MNEPINTPHHVRLAQQKAAWDEENAAKADNNQFVTIISIDIAFTNLVGFLVKLAIAAVPAGFIVFIFWSLFTGLLVNIIY